MEMKQIKAGSSQSNSGPMSVCRTQLPSGFEKDRKLDLQDVIENIFDLLCMLRRLK